MKQSNKYEETVNKLKEDGFKIGFDLSSLFNMEIKREIENAEKEILQDDVEIER